MDLIGLRSDLLAQLNRDWHVHRQLEASDERKARDKSLENTLAILKKIAGASDISLILITEKFLLNQELSLYANSPEEHNSIKTALSQLEDAEQSLRIVHNPEAYRNATNTYPAKRKENGLPFDV
ncbi:MAG: hypothetical protein LBP38_02670 [Desulfovibrio sp.]|jgi:hypothetical protein|nr:hypothetical protein [Desulfovibrio sp.]